MAQDLLIIGLPRAGATWATQSLATLPGVVGSIQPDLGKLG